MTDTAHHDVNEDKLFARSVGRSIVIGLPVAFVAITLGVWLATDLPFGRTVTASLLASILMGGFGGGFVGTVLALRQMEH